MSPNYFIFMGYLRKKKIKKQQSETPSPLYETPFQNSWTRP